MAKVLVVIARPESEKSRTLKVLKVFLDAYVKNHPHDTLEYLDLYKSNFPELDADILSAWDQLGEGTPFSDLSSSQQLKVEEFNASTEQFLAADKLVIANPMWNLMIPTKLKAWIDTIVVAGKTFRYTETAPIALTSGKKAIHIQAAGGKYNNQDFGTQYVKTMLNFIGVESVEKISIEGMDHAPEQAEEIVSNAEDDARRAAKTC